MQQDTLPRNDDGTFQSYAFPGGYPIYYLCEDGGILCPTCANDNKALVAVAAQDNDKQWNIIAANVNYEDDTLYCDHCNKRIESAYND